MPFEEIGIVSMRMAPVTKVGTIMCLVVGCAVALAQSKSAHPSDPQIVGPRRTVGVYSFEIKVAAAGPPVGVSFGGSINSNNAAGGDTTGTITPSNVNDFSAGLAGVMITALTNSPWFSVVDIATKAGGGSDSNNGGVGSDLLAPMYLIKAVMTEISCRQRSGGIFSGGFGGGQGEFENKIVLDVRLVDPITNTVYESIKAVGRKTSKSSIFGSKPGTDSNYDPSTKILKLAFSDFQASPLAEAARLAVEESVKKLSEKLAKRPWEALVVKGVAEEAGPEIYLNVDGNCGLKVGDLLELCRYGEDIVDAKTSKVIGRTKPKPLGIVEVLSTDGERVICKPTGALKDDPVLGGSGLFVRQKKSIGPRADPSQRACRPMEESQPETTRLECRQPGTLVSPEALPFCLSTATGPCQ